MIPSPRRDRGQGGGSVVVEVMTAETIGRCAFRAYCERCRRWAPHVLTVTDKGCVVRCGACDHRERRKWRR